MITKKKTIKSILGCTTVCSAMLLTGISAMTLKQPNYTTYAAGVDQIPVSLSNPNFNSNTSSSYPYAPNSYTAYSNNQKVESSSDVKSNVNAGVVNLSNEKYESRFALAKRDALDNYVLMIDSTDKDDENVLHTVNYGYQTSSTFKLDANSKYMFTVDVFTATNSKIANLYLFDNVGEVYSSIKGINSYNHWTTYTFFVATNNIEGTELKLGMYLEGAGTVLFDNLSGYKLSDYEYNSTINSSNKNSFIEVDNVDNIQNRFFINSLGQLQSTDSSTSTFSHVEHELGKNTSLTKVTDSDGQNTYALKLENKEKTYSQHETESVFEFEQNTVYKVNVSVKTKDLDGTAILELIRTDIDKSDKEYSADHNKTIKITSNTTSSTENVSNDYSNYSFLINSHSSKTVSYKLKFGLGLSDALTKGEMYLSEIEVSKINYATFDSASTGSGVEKINLVNAYSDNALYLNNGDFNAFKIADYNNPMPATPTDWSVSTGTNKQEYGVVNTKTFNSDLSGLNLSNLRNPSTDNNNVLMMYNETADTLSFTSASKKVSVKTYHKFTIDVQTQNSPLTVSLIAKKGDNEIVLSSKSVDTNYSWETVSLYLYTGYQELDVSLRLTLDSTNYAYAYADNATFDYLLTSTQLEEEFKSSSNSDLTQVVDLSNVLGSESNAKFAQASYFTTPSVSGVQSGTITLNSTYLDEVIDYVETQPGVDSNLDIFNSIAESSTDKKVLGIWTTEDVAYTATSNVGFKITSGSDKFYKISVDVFTQNLGSNNTEIKDKNLGAGIKLSGFDNPFTAIKSNNAWTTYTFYIQGESDTTTYLELSLGSEEAKTKGAVFFGNITFKDDITKEEFDLVKETETVNLLKTEKTKEEDKEESSKSNTDVSKINWFYLVPSLLTVLAILIAIIGFLARKIKWKKPTKKTKNAYDRNKTVSVQYYSRKATTMREEKIRELQADLNKINAERKQYEDVYKQDLTKLREMKIKRANPADIAKLEKELKKNQKLSSSLGVTASRISDDLNYVKTDTYLNSLIKKLMKEPSQDQKNEEK